MLQDLDLIFYDGTFIACVVCGIGGVALGSCIVWSKEEEQTGKN